MRSLSESEILWIDPPEFSDGLADYGPHELYDEDYVRSHFLTDEFRRRIWSMHFGNKLISLGTEGSSDDIHWQPNLDIKPDEYQAYYADTTQDWSELQKPLTVEFFMPVANEEIQYQKFLLLVGRNIRDSLRQNDQIVVLNKKPRFEQGLMSPPPELISSPQPIKRWKHSAFPAFKHCDDDIDVETVSDDEYFQVDVLLGKPKRKRYSVATPLTPPGSSCECDAESCDCEGTIPSLSDSASKDETSSGEILGDSNKLTVDTNTYFKLSSLPAGYRVYERLVVEYPPPPPGYHSVFMKKDDLILPKVKTTRAFAISGHPSGRMQTSCEFSRHLMFLFKQSSVVHNTDDSDVGESNEVSVLLSEACTCNQCPYDRRCLSKYRRGEIIWVSVESLGLDFSFESVNVDSFFALGIDYWPARVLSVDAKGDKISYELDLIDFPNMRLGVSNCIYWVLDDSVCDSLIPFSQYRPNSLDLIRACLESPSRHRSFFTAQICRSFLVSYRRVISSSTHYLPLMARNADLSIDSIICGSEVIHVGDWVSLVGTVPDATTYLLKVDDIQLKNDFLPISDPQFAENVCVTGMLASYSAEDNSIVPLYQEVCVALGEIAGRSYIEHPVAEYPLELEFLDMELMMTAFAPRFHSAHEIEQFIEYPDYSSTSLDYQLSYHQLENSRRLKYALKQHQQKTTQFICDYQKMVVDKLPSLKITPETQTVVANEKLRLTRANRKRGGMNEAELLSLDELEPMLDIDDVIILNPSLPGDYQPASSIVHELTPVTPIVVTGGGSEARTTRSRRVRI